jgi:hypothetical protein
MLEALDLTHTEKKKLNMIFRKNVFFPIKIHEVDIMFLEMMGIPFL